METRVEILARRGQRMRRLGAWRKAALAYGELTAVEPERAAWWVLLGASYWALQRPCDVRKALRQAAYLFRQEGETGRAATVNQLLENLDEPSPHVMPSRLYRASKGARRASGARLSYAE